MRDEPHMDQFFYAAGTQCGPSHLPEGVAIVAQYSDPDQKFDDDDNTASEVRSIEAAS